MKVVIDTNVLVSAALRDRGPERVVLFVAEHRDIEWVVSDEITEEYLSVLARPRLQKPTSSSPVIGTASRRGASSRRPSSPSLCSSERFAGTGRLRGAKIDRGTRPGGERQQAVPRCPARAWRFSMLPPLKPIPIKDRISVLFVEKGRLDVLDGAFVVIDKGGVRTHIHVAHEAAELLAVAKGLRALRGGRDHPAVAGVT